MTSVWYLKYSLYKLFLDFAQTVCNIARLLSLVYWYSVCKSWFMCNCLCLRCVHYMSYEMHVIQQHKQKSWCQAKHKFAQKPCISQIESTFELFSLSGFLYMCIRVFVIQTRRENFIWIKNTYITYVCESAINDSWSHKT